MRCAHALFYSIRPALSSALRMATAPGTAASPALRGFEFFRAIGSPSTVCAPMVDASELAFRMLVRRYGAQLCYTPMLHAGQALKVRTYLRDNFTTCVGDRPLIAQFCGNDPETLLQAALLVQDRVDAVDLNLGCPQGIARKGHYGAFLLEETDLLVRIVSTLAAGLRVPVTCKIRRLRDDERTLALVVALQEAGCSLITIHGRERDNMKNTITAVDWDIIKLVKSHPSITIPVVANGGIADVADVASCLAYTGADAVMSSEALLENPALFSGRRVPTPALAREYLALAIEHGADIGCAKGHLMKILFGVLCSPPFHDLRTTIAGPKRTLEEFEPLLDEVSRRYDRLSNRAAGGPRRSLPSAAATAAAAAAPAAATSAAAAAASVAQVLEPAGGATESEGTAASGTPADAARRRAEAWVAIRGHKPTAGLSHPDFLEDIAIPGAWFMRHRKGFSYGDAVAAASAETVANEDDGEEDRPRETKRARLVPQASVACDGGCALGAAAGEGTQFGGAIRSSTPPPRCETDSAAEVRAVVEELPAASAYVS